MVQGLISKQHSVFDENGAGSQDKGGEQVDVDVISSAAEFSKRTKKRKKRIKPTSMQKKHSDSHLYNQPVKSALQRKPSGSNGIDK